MKPSNILENFTTIVLCISAIILSAIICISWFYIHDRSLMADNMNRAIEKGVDPLSVRCSYVKSDDIICVTFAAAGHSNATAQISKK